MSFDPHTIEHLGIKMYSVLPNAMAELIANAYDAEAHTVHIKLYDGDEKKIVISDDGLGMSFDEINNNFLRIGRKRRADDDGLSFNGIRKVTGRKGLGKLAFFGIGDTIVVTTCQEGQGVQFILSWQELINGSSKEYKPKFNVFACDPKQKGTTIELSDLKRKSNFDKNGLAISLSKLFNFFDDTFKVYISYNDDEELLINDKLKYQDLPAQIIWNFPNSDVRNEYLETHNVVGQILATEKPLKPGLRGITLFAHGRLVNAPEFFGVGESSHGYSYLTGWLNVDFVDELEDDVISTDRQSLSWDLPVTSELQSNLKQLLSAIERDWRQKRKIKRQEKISQKGKIDLRPWLDKLPDGVKGHVENIIDTVVGDSEMTENKQTEFVEHLHILVPEYAYYHWRGMHPTVQKASFEDYKRADFYRAVEETIKRYESTVRTKTGPLNDNKGNERVGKDLMFGAFGIGGVLSVSKKYKKTDGTSFTKQTKENVETGQQHMSAGVFVGVRNPLAHEEVIELKESGLFTEKDCLDMLSLLSHLFRRLDDAEIK